MHPIQIEVVNSTDWWLPWLPPLGSLLVAALALFGVGWTIRRADNRAKTDREYALTANNAVITASDNRAEMDRQHALAANNAAIAAADARELNKWRREEILKNVSATLTISQSVCQGLWRHSDWSNPDELPSVSRQYLLKIEATRALVNNLRVLTDSDLSVRCNELGMALANALDASIDLQNVELGPCPEDPDDRGEAELDYYARLSDVYNAETSLIEAARREVGIGIEPARSSGTE